MSGGKSNNNNAQSKKVRAEAQAIAKAVAAAMAERPKQPPKRKERKERKEPTERRVLALNAPQVAHSLSTFFRFRAGSTPQSIVIEGRDLGATNISASSATPATFTVQYNGISCAAVSPIVALLTRWSTYASLFQRWRIRKLSVSFVSNMATTTVGNNYLAVCYDITSTPSTAQAVMRLNGSTMGNAYSDLRCTFDPAIQLRWYATTPDQVSDEQFPGSVVFGTDGYSSSLVPGKLVYDYEIEFAEPQ